MPTNISRVGAYVPNFVPDNTGRTITSAYATYSLTTGTLTVVPNAQYNYYQLPNATTGNITINVTATYSTMDITGNNATVAYGPQICDQIFFLLNGGGSHVVTYGSNITGTTGTFSLVNNKPTVIRGLFNGDKFICSSVTGV